MYCDKCGKDNNKIITSKTEQKDNFIIISHFGVCQNCGELLGTKEIFKQTDWDYIDKETIKKELDKQSKIWYNV